MTGGPKLYQKPFDGKIFDQKSPEVYDFLNELKPNLWREGETHPESSTKLDELYQNGEAGLSMSYYPQLAQRQINKSLWPESTCTYVLDGGILNNTHYVAIPFNSPNKAGAQIVASFLESPEAQIGKQDPNGWGDLTALDVDRLPKDVRKEFAEPEGKAAFHPRAAGEPGSGGPFGVTLAARGRLAGEGPQGVGLGR